MAHVTPHALGRDMTALVTLARVETGRPLLDECAERMKRRDGETDVEQAARIAALLAALATLASTAIGASGMDGDRLLHRFGIRYAQEPTREGNDDDRT